MFDSFQSFWTPGAKKAASDPVARLGFLRLRAAKKFEAPQKLEQKHPRSQARSAREHVWGCGMAKRVGWLYHCNKKNYIQKIA